MVINSNKQDIGMIVDSVTEVLRIPESSIEPTSSIISNSDSRYLLGTANLTDRLVILLDVATLLGNEDLSWMEQEAAAAGEDAPPAG